MGAAKQPRPSKPVEAETSPYELLRQVFAEWVSESHDAGRNFRWCPGSALDQTARMLKARGLLPGGMTLDADGMGMSRAKPTTGGAP